MSAIVEKGDRRYVVFDQQAPISRELGKALYEDRNGSQAQLRAFFHHLLHREVKIGVGDLIDTPAKRALMSESGGSALRFWRDVEENGWLVVVREMPAQPSWDRPYNDEYLDRDGEVLVTTSHIYDVYRDWCRRNSLKAEGGNKPTDALQEVFSQARAGKAKDKGRKDRRGWFGIPGVVEAESAPPKAAKESAAKPEDNGKFTPDKK